MLRIDSAQGRCFGNGCWSLSSILVLIHAPGQSIGMFHSADWRRNVEMQSLIATTASFVVLSVGFGWLRPHRFRHHVTWLILPVVICLSQRLSHACLSISVSLRNCEWLIKTVIVSMSVVYYLDIHGNSRANTCVQTRLLRKGCAY